MGLHLHNTGQAFLVCPIVREAVLMGTSRSAKSTRPLTEVVDGAAICALRKMKTIFSVE